MVASLLYKLYMPLLMTGNMANSCNPATRRSVNWNGLRRGVLVTFDSC